MKILVVGAGLSGCTVARTLAEHDHTVDVIDRRDHIGGNCYDYYCHDSFLVHKYGPHIFHTSNLKVLGFIYPFTRWVLYRHKIKALLKDGTYVTFPPNEETCKIVGDLLQVLYVPYSRKMWGEDVDIDQSVLNRVRPQYGKIDEAFPNDFFQGLPADGYTMMFENILRHKNIAVKLSTPFDKTMEDEYDHIFNSMPIDEYFDYQYGELPYRSLKFHTQIVDFPTILPVPTVNFTHTGKCTRITEWKLYPNCPKTENNVNQTLLTTEEPCDFHENNMERYYPIKDKIGNNMNLYMMYSRLVKPNMTFIGRCGKYQYMDMDDAIADSLEIAERFINEHPVV